jgi:hypothetical protein
MKYAKAEQLAPAVGQQKLTGLTPQDIIDTVQKGKEQKRRLANQAGGGLGDLSNIAVNFMNKGARTVPMVGVAGGSGAAAAAHLLTAVPAVIGTGAVLAYNKLSPIITRWVSKAKVDAYQASQKAVKAAAEDEKAASIASKKADDAAKAAKEAAAKKDMDESTTIDAQKRAEKMKADHERAKALLDKELETAAQHKKDIEDAAKAAREEAGKARGEGMSSTKTPEGYGKELTETPEQGRARRKKEREAKKATAPATPASAPATPASPASPSVDNTDL